MLTPDEIQIIGNEVAIRWSDGAESYFGGEFLRANSPSAENLGEKDLLGRQMGGDPRTKFPGVRVLDWRRVGNYALCFEFSDGHRTGIYTYPYLRKLHERPDEAPKA